MKRNKVIVFFTASLIVTLCTSSYTFASSAGRISWNRPYIGRPAYTQQIANKPVLSADGRQLPPDYFAQTNYDPGPNTYPGSKAPVPHALVYANPGNEGQTVGAPGTGGIHFPDYNPPASDAFNGLLATRTNPTPNYDNSPTGYTDYNYNAAPRSGTLSGTNIPSTRLTPPNVNAPVYNYSSYNYTPSTYLTPPRVDAPVYNYSSYNYTPSSYLTSPSTDSYVTNYADYNDTFSSYLNSPSTDSYVTNYADYNDTFSSYSNSPSTDSYVTNYADYNDTPSSYLTSSSTDSYVTNYADYNDTPSSYLTSSSTDSYVTNYGDYNSYASYDNSASYSSPSYSSDSYYGSGDYSSSYY
ncbi:MAG: hypothetical protein LBQ68_09530 [Clostridiales bacterium]|jgi:hypothetical protein|nr:hypothetical protein [Clostridiales bacterium]